ncbi:hypothetical protein ACFYZJ_32525 [Streptomyces sp. NPDC001848]|uniref:hypothetical protein n=1 Tax=Streptomyces sp. NPDC001848 TaxID=3364618 RepID=UPI0036A017F4
MNLRLRVAAPLVGAAIAFVFPSAGVAAQASARHVSGSPWLHDADGDRGHRNPWRDCHSQRRVVLIDKSLRVILTNGRRGPEALFLEGDSGFSPSSPVKPWTTFSPESYMDVNHRTHDTKEYNFEIRGFFRVHPLFVAKSFDRHERVFLFPAAHCINDHHDGDRAGPHRGKTAGGNGSSGSRRPMLSSPGTLSPVSRDTAAAGCIAGLLSAKYIVIAVGGLLMVLGMLAVAWLRRRRSTE